MSPAPCCRRRARRRSASISRKPSACEKLVTEPEPLPVGNATGPSSPATSDTSTNSLRPSSEAMRTGTCAVERFRRFRRQPGAGADHGRDEGMEREDRRSWEAGQHHDRFVADDAETERLARLERDAVHQYAGRAELRYDRVRQIAGALRGAAREHHHVAFRQRRAHGFFQHRGVIGISAQRQRLAAGFRYRCCDDSAIAVVDAGRFAAGSRAQPVRRRWTAPRLSAAARLRFAPARRPPARLFHASRCACRAAAAFLRARCRSPHRR